MPKNSSLRLFLVFTSGACRYGVTSAFSGTRYDAYIVSALRQMLRRPFEEVGRHHANRSGITTPIPIAKNHRAGAGVPIGRRRRSSLALILGSSICLFV